MAMIDTLPMAETRCHAVNRLQLVRLCHLLDCINITGYLMWIVHGDTIKCSLYTCNWPLRSSFLFIAMHLVGTSSVKYLI